MTDRDTVVRLAKEAGGNLLFMPWRGEREFVGANWSDEHIEKFATLIANETLERAAKVCEEPGASKYGCFCSDAIRALKE